MIQAEVSQSTSICDTFYKSSVGLREDAREQVKSVLNEELKFEKILKQEKEVNENVGEENQMDAVND